MILGIDASNIRAGGGLRHLIELIAHTDIDSSGFEKIIVWAPESTLSKLPQMAWLEKSTHTFLNRSLPFRIIWQKFYLSRLAAKYCDVLFLPSGNTTSFHPYVSMCQNLLPFDSEEKMRYGISLMRIRLELLKWNQCRSFTKADGVVFLSNYSLSKVIKSCGSLSSTFIIPHGVSKDFFHIKEKTVFNNPIKLLYVSIIDVYKHQWYVVDAVYTLLDKGYDVELTLIGPYYKQAYVRLQMAIEKKPFYKNKIRIIGNISHDELQKYYNDSDIFIFASSCETFGLILLESMASSLPIICSNRSSLPEILGETGNYFDPENPSQLVEVLIDLINTPQKALDQRLASFERAKQFSWENTANLTMKYLNSFLSTPTQNVP